MKKKALLICLLAALLVSPAFSASTAGTEKDGSFGLGFYFGTQTGVGMKFGMGKFDILANYRLNDFEISNAGVFIGFDTSCSFQVYDFKIDSQNHLPLSVGIGLSTGFDFSSNFTYDLGILVPVGISYQLHKLPAELYFRLVPALNIVRWNSLNVGLRMDAYVGALYKF